MIKQTDNLKEWIYNHEEQLVKDIRRLVKVPSIATGRIGAAPYGEECRMVAEQMTQIASGYGFLVENCDGHCIRIRYGKGNPRVEVWNHLDVVPEGEGWVYPPYACQRIDDFLIGRGVSDNKGPAIAVLYALRYLKEKGITLCYDLNQICGLSEEVGMEDADWYTTRYGCPELALISDCRFPMCYGEKGRCQITIQSRHILKSVSALFAGIVENSVADKARILINGPEDLKLEKEHSGVTAEYTEGHWAITAEGMAGHAAAPEKCVNPIGILMKVILQTGNLTLTEDEKAVFHFLRAACQDGYGEGLGMGREDLIFGKMTCAGTMLRLEERKAVLHMDIRFHPSVNIAEWVELLKKKAECCQMEVVKAYWTDGYLRDLNEPYIQTLLQAYEEVCGHKAVPYVMGGNTYARFFPKSVGFGPGIPKDYSCLNLPAGHGVGHGRDEIQSITSLLTAIEIYVTAFIKLNNLLKE